jgi:hypothetical protein
LAGDNTTTTAAAAVRVLRVDDDVAPKAAQQLLLQCRIYGADDDSRPTRRRPAVRSESFDSHGRVKDELVTDIQKLLPVD